MKDIGIKTREKVKATKFTLMGIFTRVITKVGNLMVKEYICG
jgi:hypothetical protein